MESGEARSCFQLKRDLMPPDASSSKKSLGRSAVLLRVRFIVGTDNEVFVLNEALRIPK